MLNPLKIGIFEPYMYLTCKNGANMGHTQLQVKTIVEIT